MDKLAIPLYLFVGFSAYLGWAVYCFRKRKHPRDYFSPEYWIMAMIWPLAILAYGMHSFEKMLYRRFESGQKK